MADVGAVVSGLAVWVAEAVVLVAAEAASVVEVAALVVEVLRAAGKSTRHLAAIND